MKNLRENKGITLIALIVTIVVLLIIAGISINMGITGVDQAGENKLITELEKVQHAVTERYTKYKLTKDTSLIVGTKVDNLPTIPTPTGETKAPTWKVFQVTSGATVSTHPERKYYRLSQSDLQNLGLTGSENGSSYIVNYYSGEIFDENKKQTSKGTVLYKTAMENEASELGDEYIKDGMQVWYDGINNTGSGHSSTTTTWKDLSGNGNDAILSGFDGTATSGWNSNYLAFDGENDKVELKNVIDNKTQFTIEYITTQKRYKSWEYLWGVTSSKFGMECNMQGHRVLYYVSGKHYNCVDLKGTLGKNNYNGLSIHNREINGYLNGEKKINVTIDNDFENSGNILSLGSIQNKHYMMVDYYAFRIYNRALSESEIRHNYILDKARYGIEE